MGKDNSLRLKGGTKLPFLDAPLLDGQESWHEELGPLVDLSPPPTRNGLRTLRLIDGTAVDPTRQEPYVSLDDGATPQERREAEYDPVFSDFYTEYGDDYD